MSITRPPIIQKPFAESGDKNTIPVASQVGITDGAASFETGFPPDTLIDIGDGGIAPDGLDMNGILNIITQHIRFWLAGGYPRFDATLCTEIGGYPVGTILQDNGGVNLYRNVLANNTTNFNTTPASIGVSWIWLTGQTRSIVAGAGLTGGGVPATADVTLNMGTPGSLSLTTTNSVSADSHTHGLSIPASSGSVAGITRYATGTEASDMLINNLALTPEGLGLALVSGENIKRAGKTVFETGISGSMSADANVTLTFPEAFSSTPVVLPYMINSSTTSDDVFARVVAVSATQCTLRAESAPNPSYSGTRYIGYFAIGIIN